MKEVYLSERERAVLILFSERFEGTRNRIRLMDAALDVVDPGYELAGKMQSTEAGVMFNIVAMDGVETKFEFEDAPFKTLVEFLKGQTIPYSRRPNTVGRIVMGVLDKVDGMELH